MVVAITGASGVVGSVIADHLARNNYEVKKILRADADVLDMIGLVKAFDGVDAVVHSAGLVSFNPRAKRKLFDVNVQGTRNVVNACLLNGVKKLVHISSVAALGRHRNGSLVNEENRWVPGMPVSDYAHSKYLAELEVYRGMEEGLEVSLVSPSVVLAAGNGQRSSSLIFGYVWRERRFFTDFILNYVDARDVAEVTVRLLRGGYNGEKFIASGGSIPIKKVFQEIAQRFQKRAPSINVPAGLTSTVAVLEELRAAIAGAEPTFSRQSVRSLREGLIFENTKAKKLLGLEFQPLENTLDWCCGEYRSVNINK